MDIQSFIQSGILEAYVLGQGTAEERAEVERMAAAYPQVRAELDAIEKSLEKIAQANAVAPPAGLKAQILERVHAEPAGMPAASGGRTLRLIPYLGWAATVLLGIALVWQAGQKNRLETQLTELQTRMNDCDTQLQAQTKTRELIALLRDRDTRTIVLSDATAPGAIEKVTATVWHNTKRGETALDINSLPAPDAGKYFQFWAIVDGQPVSMGMVTLRGEYSWQTLPFVQHAQAFAISAEDKPEGNPTPTVVVMVGKV